MPFTTDAAASWRRLRRGLIGLFLSAGLGAAPALGAETPVERGQDLVLRNCSMCHAVGLTGESPNSTAPHFRELARRYPIDNLAEALAEGILTAHPQMPEFVFPPEDVEAIIDYLKSIQVRQGARTPGAPAGG
jgi:mono/diheme cytochrome c family protein